ncbi:hypothetical protein PPL_05045 [Heterostelium album PN500]|uniref:Uncharacterized protein n=1 Tax=Heterostelium pallidum (strain ATCC 26659 / Pp 5 / PN500) TaxID=670386 RepID=D3B9A1_HETP5|nr:hypothetical protein PPL_05045 [Heterostelium album PN500]EFA81813.1 hypothetical protein PPL_05045 [Heterostelium album PN500]|eukprot:XP_020433930.1 hypothetical protein PPL_05045 [Heterostelium album PN500]
MLVLATPKNQLLFRVYILFTIWSLFTFSISHAVMRISDVQYCSGNLIVSGLDDGTKPTAILFGNSQCRNITYETNTPTQSVLHCNVDSNVSIQNFTVQLVYSDAGIVVTYYDVVLLCKYK